MSNNQSNNNSKRSDKTLLILIAIPIAVIMIVGGGAAFFNGLVKIVKLLVPNWWCLIGYAYAGIFGYAIAKKNRTK